MIIDMEKQRGGNRQTRTFVIGAAYRSARDGKWEKWFDTQEPYAIVSAPTRTDALLKYLASRPDLVEQSRGWSYDLDPEKTMSGQRAWTVRRMEDENITFPSHGASSVARAGSPIFGVNFLLLY